VVSGATGNSPPALAAFQIGSTLFAPLAAVARIERSDCPIAAVHSDKVSVIQIAAVQQSAVGAPRMGYPVGSGQT
jgi:hypothetical protein